MQEIIAAIPTELIKAELTPDKFVRKTSFVDNDIYIVNGNNSPNIMKEIGRLREISFRSAGGGSGKACDVDDFDYGDNCYGQVIVWNPEDEEIIGGYRFIRCIDARDKDGNYKLSTSEIVNYSDKLKTDFFPKTIELGRSFVRPEYQATGKGKKSLFALDNLWDGLGTLIVDNPDVEYLFGKVTMYRNYNAEARDHLLAFLKHYFPDPDELVDIPTRLIPVYDTTAFVQQLKNVDFKEGHKILISKLKEYSERVPPLINSYMGLSDTMRCFGTSVNTHFGGVEETGILITISSVHQHKLERYTLPYIEYLMDKTKPS